MKILVLHNSGPYRTTLQLLLQSWNYDVVLAPNEHEARSIMEGDDAPQLAILDAAMPLHSGFQLCGHIRSLTRYMYLIVLCVDDRESVEHWAYECGADDVILNPLDNSRLKLRLRVAERILQCQQELLESREALKFEAAQDPLLRLWNRRGILNLLSLELSRAERMQMPLSIFLADLDHFKQVNDCYGHLIGDEVLRNVSVRMSREIRDYDHLGRYGGEEFLAVLPNCTGEAALEIAERIRRSLAARPVLAQPSSVGLTISIGIAEWRPGQDIPDLLEQADVALYRAKEGGRNRVEMRAAASASEPARAAGLYNGTAQQSSGASPKGKIWGQMTRRNERLPLDRNLEVITLKPGAVRMLCGRTCDISRDGLGALISHTLEENEKVTLHFDLEQGKECTLAAVVRHSDGTRIGFEFVFVECSLREAIDRATPGRAIDREFHPEPPE